MVQAQQTKKWVAIKEEKIVEEAPDLLLLLSKVKDREDYHKLILKPN